METSPNSAQDFETHHALETLGSEHKIRAQKVPGVKSVLVVLSTRALAYDMDSLRQKILMTYRDSAVFFLTPIGKSVGAVAPKQVDLVIDLTGPGQRQRWGLSRSLRSRGRVVIGRNAGWFGHRKASYDRIFDEFAPGVNVPTELLERERWVQRQVLGLAGIPLSTHGEVRADRGKVIALELPRMK